MEKNTVPEKVMQHLNKLAEQSKGNIILPVNEKKLDYVSAADLSDVFDPPDEILEGLLTSGDGSVLYGDSNSGKTFLAISMGAAVSNGGRWLNRQTDGGIVLYLAVESPASVKRRLQAYHKYHRTKLDNFYVVQSPIDLLAGDGDTRLIIELVKQLEESTGKKVQLIIGDTLARLSAGANESASQDMSIVIKHFDIIRNETAAHFMLIHHSGKNANNGARGWSGVRAAVDTEMLVTDSPEGRCLEVTKQRDLDTKGLRIGFRLEPVDLGVSKFGKQTGSCIVLDWDAPAKKTSKKRGEIAGAILHIVRENKSQMLWPMDKTGLVARVAVQKDGKDNKPSVYRELRKLIADKELVDLNGIITLP